MTPEELEEVQLTLSLIGAALVGIQTVEHLIGIALLYVYRKRKKLLTLEEVERFQTQNKTDTLRNLIDQLKSQAEITDDKFSKFLKTYLERRNNFAHGLTTSFGGDLRTEQGRETAERLSFEIHCDSLKLIRIFSAVLRNWELEVGAKEDPKILSAIAFLSNLSEETGPKYLESVTNMIRERTKKGG